MGGTVYYDVLPDDVVVAYNTFAFLSNEIEVLWQCTNHSTLVYLVVVSYSAPVQDAYEWKYNAIVANHYIVFDINEWEYFAAVAYLRFRRNLGFWTNYATHTLEY